MKNKQVKPAKTTKNKSLHHHVAACFVPMKSNDYQPHLVRRYGLLLVVMVFLAVQFFPGFMTGSILGESANITEQALLGSTNQARQAAGVSDLRLNDKLIKAANLKAQDMLEKQYWAHDSPDGTKPWKWFAEAEYSYSEAGENLAKNFYTAETVTLAWLESPEHRKNLLNEDYTEVGFAVAQGDLEGQPTVLIVALYGRSAGVGSIANSIKVAGAEGSPISFMARIGLGVQSLTPSALGGLFILIIAMVVSFMAHLYRDHIPTKDRRQPVYRHSHGAIKVGLLLIVITSILMVYGSGQI